MTYLFLVHRLPDHLHTLQGRETRHEVGVGLGGLQGSRVGGTPDSPAVILAVPAEVLNNDVLSDILFPGGDGNNLGFGSSFLRAGRSGGLTACDAHDDLTDTGLRNLGDGCCAVRDDAETGEVCAGPAEVLHELPGHCFVLGTTFNLSDEFAA